MAQWPDRWVRGMSDSGDPADGSCQTGHNRTSLLPKTCYNFVLLSLNLQSQKNDRAYKLVSSILSSSSSESEVHDTLNTTVAKNATAHEDVCTGLLLAILLEPENAGRYFKDLCFVNRDGMVVVTAALNQIVIEKFGKLQDHCRSQIIWLVREMIRSGTNGVESVIFNLLRNIAGGDISHRNISLTESMLDLVIEQRMWLEKSPHTMATVLYTFLRTIVDHQSFLPLRHKEVNFCISLIRERFSDCAVIGRDLVRLLQNVARIHEFEQLWRDMLLNPSVIPNFTGIQQLMETRTPRRFLQSRLTPDMERKVVFLTSQVKFGLQKRYQEWFQKAYLSTPESQSLRCDLIRFICGVIHPSNEVLCSDIIPRWALMGWILTSCTSNVTACNCKLSLFYDWLFYDPDKDNIMNIEPAILVMHHSIRSHPVISVTLLDFLCRIISNFHPPLESRVRKGIGCALKQILEKRVLSSLILMFEAEKLDPDLRTLIRRTFPEYCSQQEFGANSDDEESVETQATAVDMDAQFSDDEGDEPVHEISRKTNSLPEAVNNGNFRERLQNCVPSKADVSLHMDQLNGELKVTLTKLMEEKECEMRCELMEQLVACIHQEEEDEEVDSNLASLAAVMSFILQEEMSKRIFPATPDDESLEDSIGTPFFVLVRYLCQTPEDDPERSSLLSLLLTLSNHIASVGYCLLYFIKVSKIADFSAYKELAKMSQDAKDLSSFLFRDLRCCQEDDVNMFCFILPDVYRSFESTVLSNPQFLHLTVSCVDSVQLADMICHVLRGDMRLLKKENVVQLINSSLEWETFEQNCLWHLIGAHSISVDNILPVLPKLEYHNHSEALTGILLSLQRLEPSADLLKHILSRDVKDDDFFSLSILNFWMRKYEKKTAEVISSSLTKNHSPAKRKRQNSTKSLPSSAELTLAHLNQLRESTRNNNAFFNQESLQSALISVQSHCTEAQKSRFSDLFALAEEVESKSKRKSSSKKKMRVEEEGISDSEASEDEVTSKLPSKATSAQRKKRKQVVHSDSD